MEGYMYKTMVSIFFVFLMFGSYLAAGSDSKTFESNVLPPKVYALTEKTPSKKQVKGILGPPDHQEDGDYYYIFHDFKYALSIKFDDGKIASFTYVIGENPYTFGVVKKKRDFSEVTPYPKKGHHRGRYISAEVKDSPFTFVFRNNSKKKLYSVIWIKRD